MLKELRIQNLAIVPELTVHFGSGLNVLTGETGAGKSILMDAIGLLAGRRSSSDDVRAGEQTGFVEGVLELEPRSPIRNILKEMGVSVEDDLIVVRRTISADGRSRAFVNQVAWTINGLAELAQYWIDISSQHGQQRLMDEASHVELLDLFGNLVGKRASCGEAYSNVKELDDQLARLRADREKAMREREFLTFQLQELVSAKLIEGELEEISATHQRMANSEKLARSAQVIEEALSGDSGALAQVGRMAAEQRMAGRMDDSLQRWASEINEILTKLNDFSQRVSQYIAKLDFDPEQIEQSNERLSKLQTIIRKYGSIEAAIAERDKAKTLLASIEDGELAERELIARREKAASELVSSAATLTSARKEASKKFSQRVTKELRELGMPSAKLSVELTPLSKEGQNVQVGDAYFGSQGAEAVRLRFAPNPGEGDRPLTSIASGGELSRVLLAVKGVAMSDVSDTPMTFVFDEVDTGIGGETAERVGIRLQVLASSKNHQVLCVTHLAQIACYAGTHLYIGKQLRAGRTFVEVTTLDAPQRKAELARMIGGIKITPRTMDHAGELLRRGTESGASL